MGTLASCSFGIANPGSRWSTTGSTSRTRIELVGRKSECFFLYKERVFLPGRDFGRLRRFAVTEDGGDGDREGGDSGASKESNLATALRDEEEERERRGSELDEEGSPPPISSRVSSLSLYRYMYIYNKCIDLY